jgi:hypothetical protein
MRRTYEKNKERLKVKNRLWYRANRGYAMIKGAKSRAKQGDLAFDLEQYRDQIQQRVDAGFCELTDIPFNLECSRAWDTPSLDRIVPEKGYVYSNVRVVCRAMNCMLGNWGPKIMEQVFLAWKEQS